MTAHAPLRLLITGSRGIPPAYTYERFQNDLEKELKGQLPDVLLNGCAAGIDEWARTWAVAHDIPIKSYPAEWTKHGKKAGILRNVQMVDAASHVVGFWDGKSPGTRQCVNYARRKQKLRAVYMMTNKKHVF